MAASPAAEANATRKWGGPSRAGAGRGSPPRAVLVEIGEGSEAGRFPLTEAESWLGSDPRHCTIVVDDPTVDPKHARV